MALQKIVLNSKSYRILQSTLKTTSNCITAQGISTKGKSLFFKIWKPDIAHYIKLGCPRNVRINERGRLEAERLATLSHKNIVKLYEHGRLQDGRYALIMEYIEGPTLSDHTVSIPKKLRKQLRDQLSDVTNYLMKKGWISSNSTLSSSGFDEYGNWILGTGIQKISYDLAPCNILLDLNHIRLVLVDFEIHEQPWPLALNLVTNRIRYPFLLYRIMMKLRLISKSK